ncbi:MAG: response regulator, partial [Ignavibacteria bacterium]|nr:response regulator [Ignavibacteria bacterium]
MNKTVLVADDSSIVQNLTRKIFSQQNYQIVSAKDGKEVLKKFKSEDIDIILMDINIPIKDGMDCTKEIRAMDDKKKASVPIIAISGNMKNYTLEDFKNAGINEFLQKPLNFD